MQTLLLCFLVFGTLAVSFAQDCPKGHEAALNDVRLKWTLRLDGATELNLTFLTGDPKGLFLVAEQARLEIQMGVTPSNLILREVTMETKLVKSVIIEDQNDTLETLNEPTWQSSEFKFNKVNVESIVITVKSTSAEMKIRNVVVKACIPVQWCEWGPWGDCEVSCGEGVRERDRECKCSNPDLLFKCDGSPKKTEVCTGPCCQKPPKWGKWADWGSCSVSCGGGTKQRNRKCNPDPCPDGSQCRGDNSETMACGGNCCQQKPKWTEWNNWGDCDVSCGGGTKERRRRCIEDECPDGSNCPGANKETMTCGAKCCPQPPKFGKWSDWGECTVSCGGGSQSRSRKCIPDACPNGDDCRGDKSETQACNEQCCIGDSKWSKWSEWGDCSNTCGDGVRSRDRTCRKDPLCPVPGPPKCPGNNIQTETCNLGCCEVPPFWSNWNPWEPCPVTCGGGIQERTRRCRDDPDCPEVGGECPGRGKDTRICNDECCPVAPKWANWKKWSSCTASCGTGTQQRRRKCKKDKICPLAGGKCRPGKKKEKRSCDGPCCEERIDFDNMDDVKVLIKGGLETRDGTHILNPSSESALMDNILLKNIDGTERIEITFNSGSRHIIQVGVETFLAGKVMLSADPGEWEDDNSVNPDGSAGFSESIFDAPGGQINNQDMITLKFGYPTGEIAVKSIYLIVCV